MFDWVLNTPLYFKSLICLEALKVRKKIRVLLDFKGVFNSFVSNAPFLYPPKRSENRELFLMFSGVRERMQWEQMT